MAVDFNNTSYKEIIHILSSYNRKIEALIAHNKAGFSIAGSLLRDIHDGLHNFFESNARIAKSKDREIDQNIILNIDICERSISEMITLLQLHDIIGQKLSHIIKIHDDLVREIHDEKGAMLSAHVLSAFHQVAQLSIAQLNDIKTDYEKITEGVAKHLLKVQEAVALISKHSHTLKLDLPQREDFALKTGVGIKNYIDNISQSAAFCSGIDELIILLKKIAATSFHHPEKHKLFFTEEKWKEIEKTYSMQSERDVFQKIIAKNLKNKPDQSEDSSTGAVEFF